MADSVAGVVLAAGAGRRLAPLTRLRSKALCPVRNRPLVDLALERLATVTGDVAVNAHRPQALLQAHVAGRAHVSIEDGEEALGTAGALGALRDWIAGRPVLVTNADAWLPADMGVLVDGWDGERVRVLTVSDPARADFGTQRYCGAALMPWAAVRDLQPVPSGLYEVSWGERHAAGTLDLVGHSGPFVDCGTPADYLAANLAASEGRSVVGPGAVVGDGAVLERSVVWPEAVVAPGERLVDAIRAGDLTVLVR
jgi:NDP-sugar pyrophosphorylase family protein